MISEYGELIQWNAKRAFGFIRPDGNGEDVFLHLSALKDPESEIESKIRTAPPRDKAINAVIMLPVP